MKHISVHRRSTGLLIQFLTGRKQSKMATPLILLYMIISLGYMHDIQV